MIRLLVSASLAALLPACSSSSNAGPADASVDVGPAPSLCSTDPRAQTFTPGMAGTASSGPLTVKLASVAPSPPDKGNNDWTIAVTDATGAPVDGLAIAVAPFMPDHGHGTSITPQVTAKGGGQYDVSLLNLFMAGIWTVTLKLADGDAGPASQTKFTFCIAG